jgi:hypothetical protein
MAFLRFRYLALRFFKWTSGEAMTLVEFRRAFSGFLIHNPFITQAVEDSWAADLGLEVICDVVTAPPFAKEYRNRKWDEGAGCKYQQYICRAPGCKKAVRTCCACSLGHWLCSKHIVEHAVEKAIAAEGG